MSEDLLAGRYRLRSLLGRGAMGEVWLADDELLHRTVAVKRLLGERNTGTDPTHADRVMREARLAARLTHPNAVSVHDLLVVDDVPCVVMEYVEGESLGARLRRDGPIPVADAARIGADVAAALEAAHAAGITHRDVKPDNVLITPSGSAKLADFGIARAAEEAAITQIGMTIGTPAYIAPEVARGAVPEPPSDIWSLGATLFAAVEGEPPFGGGSGDGAMQVLTRVVSDPIPTPVRAAAVGPIILAMLQRNPAARPSAANLRGLLSSDVTTPAVTLSSPPPTPPASSTQVLPTVPPRPRLPPPVASQPAPARAQSASRLPLAITIVAIALLLSVGGVAIAVILHNRTTTSTTTTSSPAPTSKAGSPSASSTSPPASSVSNSSTPPSTPDTTPPSQTATVTQTVTQTPSTSPSAPSSAPSSNDTPSAGDGASPP